MPRERLDRPVERAGLVVGDERERRPPGLSVHVEAHVGRDRDEARERLGVVTDVLGDHLEPVETRRPLAGDGDLSGIALLGDVRRRVGGRRRRDRGCAGHRGEEHAALVERDGVGVDGPDLRERHLLRPDEEVADRDDRLARDGERRVVEQVVRLRDGADERALDGRTPTSIDAVGRRLRDRGEARQRDELGAVREEAVARGCAVGAVASGVADDGGCGAAFGHPTVQMSSKGPPRFDS